MRDLSTGNRIMENMYAQPDQKIHFRTTAIATILHFISAAVFLQHCIVRKDTVCHMRTTITKLDCTGIQIRTYLFTLFISMYVCGHRADAGDTQAELSLPSKPKGVMRTARNCINLGQ